LDYSTSSSGLSVGTTLNVLREISAARSAAVVHVSPDLFGRLGRSRTSRVRKSGMAR
jgi:hypothetical protein